MIDFKEIRNAIPVPVAAEHYGLSVRNGMCCCLFHDDRTPSMKLYPENYYCFGCGEHGDVISLTAKLFGLSQYEAAQKISADFGIVHNSENKSIRQHIRVLSQREKEANAFRTLSDYCVMLRKWRTEYAPKSEAEELHPLFVESLQNLDVYDSYLGIFISGTTEERKEFIESGKEIAYADRRNRAEHRSADEERIAV